MTGLVKKAIDKQVYFELPTDDEWYGLDELSDMIITKYSSLQHGQAYCVKHYDEFLTGEAAKFFHAMNDYILLYEGLGHDTQFNQEYKKKMVALKKAWLTYKGLPNHGDVLLANL